MNEFWSSRGSDPDDLGKLSDARPDFKADTGSVRRAVFASAARQTRTCGCVGVSPCIESVRLETVVRNEKTCLREKSVFSAGWGSWR